MNGSRGGGMRTGKFLVMKCDNGDGRDEKQEKESNERGNESPTPLVAEAFKFVTNLVPLCM